MNNPVRIIGGGLAGLSLAHALAVRGVAVRVDEAGAYPRHRVCGEFMAGVRDETIETLGLEPVLSDALRHLEVAWYWRGVPMWRGELPRAALGLSRHCMDGRIAERLRAAGGELVERSRVPIEAPGAGEVLASGRRIGKPGWIGLKMHARRLPTEADLELHLSQGGYVGLARIEDGRCNVCGLFRAGRLASGGRVDAFLAQLRHAGLEALAWRVAGADPDPESFAAVSHLHFETRPDPGASLRLGDAYAVIPPFTGNGMTLALESAETVLPAVLDYACGRADWSSTVARSNQMLAARFGLRLRVAGALQPLLLSRHGFEALAILARSGLLPFRFLYSLTH